MTMMPVHYPDQEALVLIEQLRDALKHADAELQRRCIISGKNRLALSAAEAYLAFHHRRELPRYEVPPIPRF